MWMWIWRCRKMITLKRSPLVVFHYGKKLEQRSNDNDTMAKKRRQKKKRRLRDIEKWHTEKIAPFWFVVAIMSERNSQRNGWFSVLYRLNSIECNLVWKPTKPRLCLLSFALLFYYVLCCYRCCFFCVALRFEIF